MPSPRANPPCRAEAFEASSSFLAAGCCGLSLAWAVVAYTLGLRFDTPVRRSADPPGKPRPVLSAASQPPRLAHTPRGTFLPPA